MRHEQATGHMADAYSRVTGQTGVVLATSGPGATNAFTAAIATAVYDSIPDGYHLRSGAFDHR